MAFYLYVLRIPGWIGAAVVLVLALLTFVPSYYMYPSRGATLSRLTNFLGGVWVVLLVWILWDLVDQGDGGSETRTSHGYPLAAISLFYQIYYMAVSWGITVHRWRHGGP